MRPLTWIACTLNLMLHSAIASGVVINSESDLASEAPAAVPLALAKTLDHQPDVNAYLVSEKYDGVRARWQHGQLFTRGGKRLNPPPWFIANWPKQPLDGELWAGRQGFSLVTNTVLDSQPNMQQWRAIRFMVFDAPPADTETGSVAFAQRYKQYQNLVAAADSPYLKAVEQHRFSDYAQMHAWFTARVAEGAEGVMLHRADAPYTTGRSGHIWKLKPYMDAEATVVGYQAGKGQFQGMMGALLVTNDQGLRFKIGTGFSHAERAEPPPIGAIITYTYHGYTKNGLPRFASFLRVRELPNSPVKHD
ncbi:DNA ligase [Pseudoalteromonas sp. YIC-827]|uniref:DNA ligase n=1 Tax=Pseudoalteromonas qingdaonensis TaxID=3131913 RepID=A0ABU9MZF8_9GAMM